MAPSSQQRPQTAPGRIVGLTEGLAQASSPSWTLSWGCGSRACQSALTCCSAHASACPEVVSASKWGPQLQYSLWALLAHAWSCPRLRGKSAPLVTSLACAVPALSPKSLAAKLHPLQHWHFHAWLLVFGGMLSLPNSHSAACLLTEVATLSREWSGNLQARDQSVGSPQVWQHTSTLHHTLERSLSMLLSQPPATPILNEARTGREGILAWQTNLSGTSEVLDGTYLCREKFW